MNRARLIGLAMLVGCATPAAPSGDTAELTPDGSAWVVVLDDGGYYCRVPVDGGAGHASYPSEASALRACRAIRRGWVPPW